jgi:hypothetical protein
VDLVFGGWIFSYTAGKKKCLKVFFGTGVGEKRTHLLYWMFKNEIKIQKDGNIPNTNIKIKRIFIKNSIFYLE